ncbi:MAG: hypothetical protein V4482_01865 [Pseudomonadota bacterium]
MYSNYINISFLDSIILWIPAYAGMTKDETGMTKDETGMAKDETGMTKDETGMT